MNPTLRRALDWVGYAGVAVLVAAVLLPFLGRPGWLPVRSWLVAAGVLLVLASLLGHLGDFRGTFARRGTRYGLNTALMVLIVLGIIGLVEAVSYRHSARLDLTENKRHSLSPQTIQLLRALTTDVNAVGFFRSDQPGKRVAEDLFKQYARYANGKFTWKVVDPDREPGLARRYGVESYGTVVLETKAKSEKVTDAEEEKLTNGLIKVTREGKRVVYVLQGHGEHELTNTERPGFSEAKTAMEQANYEVKPLLLAREGKVPDDAAVVIDPGPRTELLGPEVDALDAYLGRGGKLLVMVDSGLALPIQSGTLKTYLAKYGVVLGDDLVIETNPIGRLFGFGVEVPIVQQYESHAITRDMNGVMTAFPVARSVEPAKTPPTGVMVQPLAKTSEVSWGETSRDELASGQLKKDDKDVSGPLSVAAVATRDKARLVVYGSSTVASNNGLGFQGNRDFFLNTVSWLAEEEAQISIRPKESRQTPVFLTSQQAQVVFLLPLVVLPAIVIVGGVVAFARRRSAQ
jgi:gliding motility-associatede transport system auxiliary component